MNVNKKEKCNFPGCKSNLRGQTLFSIETLNFCEKHFDSSEIFVVDGCKQLKEGVIPQNFEINPDYCRFCMKVLISDRDKILINDTLKNLYEELTGLKLKFNELPNNHCKVCSAEILNSLATKRKLIETQETFINLLKIKKLEVVTENFPEIKEEFEIEIVNGSNLNEDQVETYFSEVEIEVDIEQVLESQAEDKIIPKSKPNKTVKRTSSKKDSLKQKVQCEYCNREIGKNSYNMHVKQIHEKIPKYECDLCGFKVFLKSRLRVHMNNKHISRKHRNRFPCTYENCNKSYLQKYVLNQHIIHDHLKKSNVVCEICGATTKSNSLLKDHIRLKHTFEKPFQCEVKECGATFSTIASLCDHRDIRHPQRAFTCTICNLSFSKRSTMKFHRRNAHNQKTIICEFEDCKKAFFTQYLLQDHLDRIHYKLKKYECDLCRGQFSNVAHVNEHFRNIHIKPRYGCEVPGCNCVYARKDFLRNHIKAVHKDLDEDYFNILLENVKNLKQPEIDRSIYTFTKIQ